MTYYNYTYTGELCHYGIKGQKWGVRRYQNEDGSYTAAGKKRYNVTTKVKDFGKKHSRLVKTAKVAANIATLGATGRIEKSEKAYREAQKRGAKETAAGLVIKGALRAYATEGNKQADRILRTAAASAAAAAYVASSGNPKVKAGAMVAGKIFSAMATTSLALSTSYNVYAQARDTANYVKQKRSKKNTTERRRN